MKTLEYDLAIAGGGIIGLCTAFVAARHGLKVIVLERETAPGKRASWAGAGMLNLRPWPKKDLTHPDYQDLMAASIQLHARWAGELRAETGMDVGYLNCGALEIFSQKRMDTEGANFQRRIEGARERKVVVEPLTVEEARRMEPHVNFGDAVAVLHYPQDGQVRNPWLTRTLHAACEKRGVVFKTGAEVKTFEFERSRASALVLTTGEKIYARNYALCTGAWSGLFPELGERSPRVSKIEPVRGQLAYFETRPGLSSRLLLEGHHYLVPRADGVYLAGATTERVGFVKETTPQGQQKLRDFAMELLPGLKDSKEVRGWADFRPGLKGRHPLLGPVPGYSNVLIGAGHYRNGVGLGPISGQILGDLAAGKPPQIDISPWVPESGAAYGGSDEFEEH